MKKTTNRILSLLLSLAMLLSMLPTAFATGTSGVTFQDVGEDHWAYSYVEQAVQMGLFVGITPDTFGPALTMSRGMFMVVLNRLSGEAADDYAETPFTDVTADQYYAGAIAWAVDNGIANGTSSTTFSPDAGTTRQEAAAFLYRYAQYAGLNLPALTQVQFTDEDDIQPYAQEAVAALAAAGVLKGYPDGSFRPAQAINRAEGAALFVGFAEAAQPAEASYYGVQFVGTHVDVLVDGRSTTYCTVKEGQTLTFTVQPHANYAVAGLSVSGAELTGNDDGSYTLSGITEQATVSIRTEAVVTAYAVTFLAENAGVIVNGKAVTQATVASEDTLTFTVCAAEGYVISDVLSDSGSLTDCGDGVWTLTGLTADAVVTVIAVPAEIPAPETYTVTFVTDDGIRVYVDGVQTQTAVTSSEDSSFSFSIALTQEHTSVYSMEVSPSGKLYQVGDAFVLTQISGNTTVTLTTGPERFAVRFLAPDGTEAAPDQQVAWNTSAVRPEDPAQEGSSFFGWYADRDLTVPFDFTTPVTEATTVYAGFGKAVDTVYLNGQTGSNRSDGASPETAVATFEWAAKLVSLSETKTIAVTGTVVVTGEETWDLSDLPEAKVIAHKSLQGPASNNLIYLDGTANLCVKGITFICEPDHEQYMSATLAYAPTVFVYDADGNLAVDENGDHIKLVGSLSLTNCDVSGFGGLPSELYGDFYNYTVFSQGSVTVTGGAFHNNYGGGSPIYVSSWDSTLHVDGTRFYDNECVDVGDVSVLITGEGGAISADYCCDVVIRNAEFRSNSASNGGAIYSLNGEGKVIVENCTFVENNALDCGGAIYMFYGSRTMELSGNNVFEGNTATTGGAVYTNNATTITGGTFRGNAASGLGSAIFSGGELYLVPEGELALDDGIFMGASNSLKLGASVANNAGTITMEVDVALPGRVLVAGENYSITEADFAKFDCQAADEIVLNTEKNVIQIKEAKEETGGEEEPDTEPHNLSTVYLSGSGKDSNDGASAATPVATFAKAKGLLARDGIIYITGRVDIKSSETWSLEPETFGSAKVVRHENFTNDYLIKPISCTLTLKDITLDGGNVNASKGAIYCTNGTVYLSQNAVMTGHLSTGSYGVAVYAYQSALVIDGATITGCAGSGGSYGAIFYARSATMISGSITNCRTSGYKGGCFYAKEVIIRGGTIENNEFGSGSGVVTGYSGGTVEITGGKITNNYGQSYIVSDGSGGSLTITGGEISNNTIGSNEAGAVRTGGHDTVALTGGVISGNVSAHSMSDGGGLYVSYGSMVTIDGVVITNNSADEGGGIYIKKGGYLTILSGIISGNTATSRGDAIYVPTDLALTVTPNEKGLTLDGELWLNNASDFRTGGIVVGDLTNLSGKLSIGYASILRDIVVGTPADGYTFTEADLAKFSSVGCNMTYTISDEGKIVTVTYPVETITLDNTELFVMATYSTTLTAYPGPAEASNLSVNWFSSDDSVADVSGDSFTATVCGISPGTAVITAMAVDGGVTATCKVTVTENTTPITSLTLDQTEVSVERGKTTRLTATVAPYNAYDTTVTWTSSDPSLVSVDAVGSTVTVTAIDYGTATVTATAADGTSAACTVTVADIPVEGVSLSAQTLSVYAGDSAGLSCILQPLAPTIQDVVWTVGDEQIVQLELYGTEAVVCGMNPGTTTVTATTVDGGLMASCTVTVTENEANLLELDREELDLVVYQTFNITALFDKYWRDVTWTSSDPETVQVLRVSGNQVTIKALGEGTAVITATAADGQTKSCTIDVAARVAGTLDEVYVACTSGSSDANSGADAEHPVRTLTRAMELLAVDGTIYLQGDVIYVNDGENIALPKEIYGDAKIVVLSETGEADFGWGMEYYNYTPDLNFRGSATLSNVTIDYSQAEGISEALYLSSNANVCISNGFRLLGSGGKTSQNAFYIAGGSLLMNGGEILNFVGEYSYATGSVNGGTFTMNGGRIVNEADGEYYGMIYLNGGTFTMNGGEISGNCYANDYCGTLMVCSGNAYLNGGTLGGDCSGSHFSVFLDWYCTIQISARYGLDVQGQVTYYDEYSMPCITGSLRNLKNQLHLYVYYGTYESMSLAQGSGKTLTHTELSKICCDNGCGIYLDIDSNVIRCE